MRHQLDITLPLQAAGTGRKIYHVWQGPKLYMESIKFVPDDSVSAHATNYTDVTLTNETDSVQLHTWSTVSGGDGALTAGTPVSATLTEGTARILETGDVLSFEKADTASGQALGGTYSVYGREWRE